MPDLDLVLDAVVAHPGDMLLVRVSSDTAAGHVRALADEIAGMLQARQLALRVVVIAAEQFAVARGDGDG
jgi:hypothetical protein